LQALSLRVAVFGFAVSSSQAGPFCPSSFSPPCSAPSALAKLVGGRPAEVLYSGAAPGPASGVVQIDARIAQDVSVRGAATVYLVVGESSNVYSTASVFIGDPVQ